MGRQGEGGEAAAKEGITEEAGGEEGKRGGKVEIERMSKERETGK